MDLPTSNSLNDPRAEGVLARLHAQGDREFKYLVAHQLKRWLFGWFTRPTPGIDWAFLRDKLVPLHPDKCRLAYILGRSLQARRVVEFGTSGMVIGTEIEPTKAEVARANIAEAGLADYVEVREGNATETLKNVGGPADFLLMDSWTDFARPIIEIMAPQLRPGAIVMADNVPPVPRAYRPYIEYVRNPANGFRSMNLPYKGGVEISVRVP
jgi:Methyltransferase domain